MSWSLRRVLVVLTAVAACGTVACLPAAFAQFRRTAPPAAPAPPIMAGRIIIG